MIRTYSLGFLALLLVSMSSCGGSELPTETTDPPTPVATTLTVTPASVSFSVLGETEQLTAAVLDQNQATMSGAPVTWSSSGSSVASVSSTGLVTAVADGTATITATSGAANGSASVTVLAAPITLSPSALCSDHRAIDIATFEDANLEALVRLALGIGAGDDLTCGSLSGVTELTPFGVAGASLVGIQNLTGFTKLVHGLTITDLSLLSGLTSLTYLSISSTSITDISALSGLTSLAYLDLGDNYALSDIGPLLANPGIGAGDEVDLGGTDVSCLDVARLQFKGVEVSSDC